MNSEKSLSILSYISRHTNGRIPKNDLYEHYPHDRNIIASLSTGTRPNIYLDSTTNDYVLTQRGYDSLNQAGASLEIDRSSLPDYIRERTARISPNTANGQNMLELIIDRNDYIKISVTIHKQFIDWIKANGTVRSFKDDFGLDVAHNWDGDENTKYIACNLQNIDTASRGSGNIITSNGFNSLLIKLASAQESGSYTIKYRGLVAWEQVQLFGTQLAENTNSFYKNYVKPFHFKIAVQYFI